MPCHICVPDAPALIRRYVLGPVPDAPALGGPGLAPHLHPLERREAAPYAGGDKVSLGVVRGRRVLRIAQLDAEVYQRPGRRGKIGHWRSQLETGLS